MGFFGSRNDKKREQFYNEHSSTAYAILLRYDENKEKVADRLQQLFITVFQSADREKVTKQDIAMQAVKISLCDVLGTYEIDTCGGTHDTISNDMILVQEMPTLSVEEITKLLLALPVAERCFYEATYIDEIDKQIISVRTGWSIEKIEQYAQKGRSLLYERINQKN